MTATRVHGRLVDRARLIAHLTACHPSIRIGVRSTGTLAERHAIAHHRYWTSHHHAGSNTGPGDRPDGWYTGDDAVPNPNPSAAWGPRSRPGS